MPTHLLLALAGFAFVASITPGPNNLMLLASGVKFGFRRTIPHMLGIGVGFVVMLLVIGLGLGQLLLVEPRIYQALRIACLLYLLWLAWKIARSGPVSVTETDGRAEPLNFIGAALFQCPGWIFPMSVSSTRVLTCTRFRSAILSRTVPPPTVLVGEEMTWPRSMSISMIVPVLGARTSV